MATMREMYRILDANFNRAREALRVIEDCGRFAMNDPAITVMAKNMRSDLSEMLRAMPADEMITSRDTPGDIGTEITSPTEVSRDGLGDVASAACKRLSEALRSIEEYSKVVSPDHALQIERMRYNGYTLEKRLVGRLMVGRRMRDVKLYVLVSSEMCSGSFRECVRSIIAGGADVIQLREKHSDDDVFLARAAELRELTDEMGRIFIINDRPDIAAIVGADGVHLGRHDLPIAETRRLLRPGAIVGKSSNTIEQSLAAVNEGADYVAVGPMYKTATKDRPGAGPQLLRDAIEKFSSPLPIVPVGGIDASNVGELIAAGARRVAVCSAICRADNPQAAAAAIKQLIG